MEAAALGLSDDFAAMGGAVSDDFVAAAGGGAGGAADADSVGEVWAGGGAEEVAWAGTGAALSVGEVEEGPDSLFADTTGSSTVFASAAEGEGAAASGDSTSFVCTTGAAGDAEGSATCATGAAGS